MSIGNLADELNDVIRCIETELEKLGVPGGTGEIKYPHGVFHLKFGRSEGEWHLLAQFPASGEILWLLNTSLEIRCVTMDHLDVLYLELRKAGDAQRAHVETALRTGREFYKRLRGDKP